MRVSWTRFSSYQVCSLQYVLKYRRHIFLKKDQRPFLVGSVVHDVMCAWARAGFPKEGVRERIEAQFRQEAKKSTFASPDMLAELFTRAVKGALLAERLYRLLKLPEHDVIVEPRFQLSLPSAPQHSLIGGYDVYDPVTTTVYDLKLYHEARTLTDYERGQLRTYGLALRIQGHPVTRAGFLTPLLKKQVSTFDLSSADLDRQEELLLEMIRDDPHVAPLPSPGTHCLWCDYRATRHCTYYQRDIKSTPGRWSNNIDLRAV